MTVWDPVQARQGVALAQECLRSFAEVGALVVPEDTGPPTFRGLRCIRDVVANEVLLRVPIAHCINVDRARREIQVDVPLLAQAQTLTGQDVLCLWLIFERAKGPLSTYAALTASLPVECSEMSAAFWPEESIAELAGCSAKVRLEAYQEQVDEAFTRVDSELKNLPRRCELVAAVDRASYRWARCILNSRQFGQELESLVPCVEFVNMLADAPSAFVRRSTDSEHVELVAARNHFQGEEVFFLYCRAGNAQLLAERGFVCSVNPFDAFDLFLEVKVDQQRLPLIRATAKPHEGELVWKSEPGSGAGAEAHIICSAANPLPTGLLALVCLECMDETALQKATETGTSFGTSVPYEPEIQRAALLRLLAVVRGLLSNFPTTLIEDEQLLASGGVAEDPFRGMAVRARASEKRVMVLLWQTAVERLLALLCQCQKETAGSKAQFLAGVQLNVQTQQETVMTQFQWLHSGPLSSYSPAVSRLVVFARAAFLWLHGKLGDLEPRVSSPALYEEWATWHQEAKTSESSVSLTALFDKLSFWGAYLLAQFAVTGAFDLSALDAMQGEAHDLRVGLGWLPPPCHVVTEIKALGSVALAGDSVGAWRRALVGVDVERCDIIEAKASEKVPPIDKDVLFMASPDWDGVQRSLSVLDDFKGKKLFLVGEWFGHSYALDGNLWGSSFSKEFQKKVARDFVAVSSVNLPTLPLYSDRFMVWERLNDS